MKAHFQEALDELELIVGSLDQLEEVEVEIALAHVYRHLNVAWNGRHDSERESVAYPSEIAAYLE